MGSNGKKIISNSVILVGSQIFNRAIRIILVIFSARLLGVESYGQFSFALFYTIIFMVLADMGIHQLMVREVSRKPEMVEKYMGNALFIKFVLALISFILMFVLILLTQKPKEVILCVYFLGGHILVNSFIELFRSLFQAFQQMKYDGLSNVFQSFLTTLFGLIVLLFGGNIIHLSIVFFTVSLITLGYCILITILKFTNLRIDFDFNLIKFQIREGLPIGISYFFSTLYTNIGSVLLSLMSTDKSVGWFSAAYRLVNPLLFVSWGTMKAIFPILSESYKLSFDRFTQLFEKTFKFMYFLGFSLAVIITLLSSKIILFLYGEEYFEASKVIIILVWSVMLIFLTNIMSYTNLASDRQRITTKIIAIGAAVNLAANFYFIPRLSHLGVAYATLITEGFIFSAHFIYLYFRFIKPPIIPFTPKVILINGIVGFSILLLKNYHLFIIIPIITILYLGLIVLTKYFTKDEIDIFRDYIRNIKR